MKKIKDGHALLLIIGFIIIFYSGYRYGYYDIHPTTILGLIVFAFGLILHIIHVKSEDYPSF
jgi:hypothetical protein